ncbi:5-oxoprolinase subunit PxpB [Winogradskyella echinorum]|uniref:5-oxoprolinase subunit PxpB n=1 Tax=Winogradskyella echinorum TaxID=538189 RepID=A0ABR6Y095_9FLAO|nr:5-oxoprolinase subunit PxpB [Winogradskyella echinorum]MBC3846176.1 5-oxoprolinase subunit PxpB [Winogradskyella echinorum]MBC5750524.1 5-oxoprolinase subunit PxpB [Winogradskyella echinorum]
MLYHLQYSRFNECSVLIEWPELINEDILKNILNFKNKIENSHIKHLLEVINTYSSILIIYKRAIDNVNDEILRLRDVYSGLSGLDISIDKTWHIPVCYDSEFAVDLDQFSKAKYLSNSEIIRLHSQTIYTVYFIGFLPGFLYLGGLDSKLFFDRKSTPNLSVKKGSVAIGGKQTGIYPQDSPGGWHVIGNSPIDLFNSNNKTPCFIKAGDKIQFKPISISDYNSIKESVCSSTFDLNSLLQ